VGDHFQVLHVRIASPPEVTGRLLETLTADSGVLNLVVLKGAARRPDGDAVQFDLRPGSANPVFRQLRDLRPAGLCSVMVETVDAPLAEPPQVPAPPRPERPRIGERIRHGELAPVWEMVEARIRAGGVYPPSFFVLLVIAALIAAVGILTNSQILVVGAMVVGPEYGAIIAVALGIDQRQGGPVRRGLSALLWGFLTAIAAAVLFGVAIRWSGHTPHAYELGVRPVAALIDNPNLFSVIVAVLAGLVGVVSLTESRANALIGVFISVTTIPAAAAIGLSLAYESWSDALGSTEQLLLNVGLLIVWARSPCGYSAGSGAPGEAIPHVYELVADAGRSPVLPGAAARGGGGLGACPVLPDPLGRWHFHLGDPLPGGREQVRAADGHSGHHEHGTGSGEYPTDDQRAGPHLWQVALVRCVSHGDRPKREPTIDYVFPRPAAGHPPERVIAGAADALDAGAAPHRRYAMQANGATPEAGGQWRVEAPKR